MVELPEDIKDEVFISNLEASSALFEKIAEKLDQPAHKLQLEVKCTVSVCLLFAYISVFMLLSIEMFMSHSSNIMIFCQITGNISNKAFLFTVVL